MQSDDRIGKSLNKKATVQSVARWTAGPYTGKDGVYAPLFKEGLQETNLRTEVYAPEEPERQ
jgi:hypothetical protein